MKHGRRWISLLLAALLLLGLAGGTAAAAPGGMDGAAFLAQLDALGKGADGTRLVVKTGSNAALGNDFGALAKAEGYNAWHVLQYADKDAAARALDQLRRQPGVVYVQISQRVSLIEPFVETTNGSGEAEPMSWGAPMVQSPEMKRALAGRELPDIVIAILDTGLDFTHPYFEEHADRITGRFAFSHWAQDDYGHGTHVAGIICDNAPDNVKISPYKVLDGWGYGNDIYIATAMCAAADDGVDIISMSLGGPGGSVMDDAVVYAVEKGVAVVASAGNNNWDASNNSPAGAPLAITVSAVNKDGTPAFFSNYGAAVDIAAPGGYAALNEETNAINSTTPLFCGSYYQKWAGTSMSAPFVSAAAAVLKSLYPGYTPADIKYALKYTARKTQNWDSRYGAGILNCVGLLNPPEPQPPEPPVVTRSLWQWVLYIFFFGWLWM